MACGPRQRRWVTVDSLDDGRLVTKESLFLWNAASDYLLYDAKGTPSSGEPEHEVVFIEIIKQSGSDADNRKVPQYPTWRCRDQAGQHQNEIVQQSLGLLRVRRLCQSGQAAKPHQPAARDCVGVADDSAIGAGSILAQPVIEMT